MKRLMKILSIMLCIVIVVSSLPFSAIAASKKDVKEEKAEIITVHELTDKRDVYSKTYETSEGTNIMVVSSSPLHFEKDGELKEIDNSLIESKKDSSILTNKNNVFSVELPKRYKDESEISLEYEKNKVSFKLLSNKFLPSKGEIKNATKGQPDSTDAEQVAKSESNISKLSSSIKYKELMPSTDIEYTVGDNRLKESVVLKEQPSEDFSIQYEVNVPNMKAVVNKDNSISIVNNEGTEIYLIERPYMFDNDGNETDAIDVSFEQTNDKYLLTYTPDNNWLTNEKTTYPVTIDPTITVSGTYQYYDEQQQSLLTKPYIQDTYSGNRVSGNKSGEQFLYVQRGSTYKWTYFNISHLPALSDNAVIKSINLNLYVSNVPTSQTPLGLYYLNSVTSENFVETVTKNSLVDATSNDIFVDTVLTDNASGSICLNLTPIKDELYDSTKTCNNILLKSIDGAASVEIASSENNTSNLRPYLTVEYNNLSGIDSQYQYHTQDNGLAGNAYVNDYTGELTVERTEFQNANESGLTFYMGKGVNAPSSECLGSDISINYYQTLEASNITGYDYVLNYADGHCDYIDSSYDVDTTNVGTISVGRKEGEDYIEKEFTLFNSSYLLTKISETSNIDTPNKKESNNQEPVDLAPHETVVTYDNGYLLSIENDISYYEFEYHSDRFTISQYSNVDSSIISEESNMDFRYNMYVFNNNTLTVYLGADENSFGDEPTSDYGVEIVTYDYNSDGNITKIKDSNGKYFKYYYNTNYKVSRVEEHSTNDTLGESVDFLYNMGVTTVSDGTKTLTEYFDEEGKLVEILDQDGNAIFAEYDGSVVSSVSDTRNSARNIIDFYSFESGSDSFFETENGVVTLSTDNVFNGNHSVKLTCPAQISEFYSGEIPNLKQNTTYTVAMWVKKQVADTNCSLRISNGDNNGVFVTTNSTQTNEWQQLSCTINTYNHNKLNISLLIDNVGVGSIRDVYVDYMYVQQSPVLTNVNLIQNGDFSNTLNHWTSNNNNVLETDTDVISTADTYRLKMSGNYNMDNSVSQTISVSAQEGTKFTFGGWAKAVDSLPDNENREFSIKVYAVGNNNQEYKIDEEINYSTYCSNWQYIEKEFVLGFNIGGTNDTYSQLRLEISYNNQNGYAYFDGVSLAKDELFSVEFDYNSQNEIIGISSHETTISSNSNTNEPSENLSKTYYDYDDYGNVKEIEEYVKAEDSSNNIAKKILHEYKYSNNYSLLTEEKNYFGKAIDYNYDKYGNITYQNDENGRITEFEYDNLKNLSAIIDSFDNEDYVDDVDKLSSLMTLTSDATDDNTIRIEYTYNANRLERIDTISNDDNTPFNTYEFTYDEWGNLSAVYINNNTQAFVQYVYDSSKHYQLNSIQYINGQKINYSYDNDGNVIYESDDNGNNNDITLSYSYFYYDGGTCYAKKDLITGTIESYQDGLTTVIDENGNIIHAYGYDSEGNKVQQLGSCFIETDNSSDIRTTTVNGVEYTNTRTYDEFGRLATEKIQRGSTYPYILKEYSYYADGHMYSEEPESGQNEINTSYNYRYVKTYQVDSNEVKTQIKNYTFSYFFNDDCFSKDPGSNPQIYMYNGANMVLYGGDLLAGSFNNCEYDSHGNLSMLKSTYSSGSDLLGYHKDSINNIRFTYDGSQCGTTLNNCLTQYKTYDVNISSNEETLTDTFNVLYDSQGNTDTVTGTSKTINYDWCRGNVLNETTIVETIDNSSTSTNIEYSYDDNNIRTNKTVRYDQNNYLSVDYLWEDNQLVGEKIDLHVSGNNDSGKYNTVILYDQDDNAYGFVVNKTENASGVSVNETNTFYYHKDNMNTIMRIINEDGTNAASFKYEVYGNIHSAEYSYGKEYLKYVNPLLYHDYIFDDDTQLYYLQSRYYAPQLGRFISADSLYDNGSGTITATNMYAYCDNDPINKIDPNGHFSVEWVSTPIDIAVALLCPGAAISYDVTGFIVQKAVKRSGWKYGYQVLKGTLPVVRGVFTKFYTAIRKVVGKVAKGLITKVGSKTIELLFRCLTSIVSKGKWNTKEIFYSIAMFFSFGSFIAGILDFVSDGTINGWIKV